MGKIIFAHLTPINGWKILMKTLVVVILLIHMMRDTMMQIIYLCACAIEINFKFNFICCPMILILNNYPQ
jgi:hypothetical protein